MIPKYKFNLYTAGAQVGEAHPLYGDDLAVEYAQENNQQFFRGKLSGKLTFIGPDYDFIAGKPFDTRFGVSIQISHDGGANWEMYWVGRFWKTDCEFDEDNKTAEVQPSVEDAYTAVLNGMEKEFDLLTLAPAIQPVKMKKRPMIQVYVPGQSVIGCFLSNMWWEQDCDPRTNEQDLIDDNHFARVLSKRIVEVSGTTSPELPSLFIGDIPAKSYQTPYQSFEYAEGDWKLTYDDYIVGGGGGGTRVHEWKIIRISDNTMLWWAYHTNQSGYEDTPYSVTLDPVAGTGASGQVTLEIYDRSVFARMITDRMNGTAAIPPDDLVSDNHNYDRVVPYNMPSDFVIYGVKTSTPTEWGIYQPGIYYQEPHNLANDTFFPIARQTWTAVSYWFKYSTAGRIYEEDYRADYELRDAYPLDGVLKVLLHEIAPTLSHDGTSDYSEFLYGSDNPLTHISQRLFVTPKSNIVTSGYDEPAQKAPVTLKAVLEMLRDCFRCYWFIDEQKRFRIEHIRYFMYGGSYTNLPNVGIDLTSLAVPRTGKAWDFASKHYTFEKPEMSALYQFRWMDDVTLPFEGMPLEIVSRYVQQDKVEDIAVTKFTSDIDYLLLNPTEASKDGFVLLGATLTDGEYIVPFAAMTIDGVDYVLQNAYLAFAYLQRYYLYDLPAYQYRMNGSLGDAYGVKKLRLQSIKFPAPRDPDLMEIVQTSLGYGMIQKISITLSSRTANATLKYDTE